MAIECYTTTCPHHEVNQDGDGPFCHQRECIADKNEQIVLNLARRIEGENNVQEE